MNKIIHIINYRYLDDEKKVRTVGGIQTYIYNLCNVIKNIGFVPVIYQVSKESFEVECDGTTVKGIACKNKELSKFALKLIPSEDIVIFATEELTCKHNGPTISIQHGIYWDRPNSSVTNNWINSLYIFRRARQAYGKLHQMSLADIVVCVDYNFLNWYRSLVAYPHMNTVVIPNFTEIPQKFEKATDIVNIIFARRFIEFRGTKIFAKAIISLLSQYPNISVTLAGEGPDEEWLKEKLEKYQNVSFVKYCSNDSIKIHRDKHIAVIPTTGSEGTSLSLLEAMASNCAVICTDVGGMTNIVIDGYNGRMVRAGNVEELSQAIQELLDFPEKRCRLAECGYDTVKYAFSYARWESQWKKLLLEFSDMA